MEILDEVLYLLGRSPRGLKWRITETYQPEPLLVTYQPPLITELPIDRQSAGMTPAYPLALPAPAFAALLGQSLAVVPFAPAPAQAQIAQVLLQPTWLKKPTGPYPAPVTQVRIPDLLFRMPAAPP